MKLCHYEKSICAVMVVSVGMRVVGDQYCQSRSRDY